MWFKVGGHDPLATHTAVVPFVFNEDQGSSVDERVATFFKMHVKEEWQGKLKLEQLRDWVHGGELSVRLEAESAYLDGQVQ